MVDKELVGVSDDGLLFFGEGFERVEAFTFSLEEGQVLLVVYD